MIFYNENIVNDLPTELLSNRHNIEGNMIMSLWKKPELYIDFSLEGNDFLTREGRLLFEIGKQMIEKGINEFTELEFETFLSDKQALKEFFDNNGGFNEIKYGMNAVSVNNAEMYYEELNKWNTIINLYQKQQKDLNVINNLDKLKKMDSQQINDFFDYHVADSIRGDAINGSKPENFYITEEMIEAYLTGSLVESVSFGLNCPLLNYIVNGWEMGTFNIIAAYSGAGKSTFMLYNSIYPLIKQGVKCCLMSNELSRQQYLTMLIPVVLVDHFKYYNLTRKKAQMQQFNSEDLEMVKKAVEYINEHLAPNFLYQEMTDYSVSGVVNTIKKTSTTGYQCFFYDTFKADVVGDKAWTELVEASKQLANLAKKQNVAIICSYQIANHNKEKRSLSASMLSGSKQVTEVAHTVLLMRKLMNNEYTGEKHDVKPYRKVKDINGKYTNNIEEIKLDKQNQYSVIRIDKARSGQDGIELLYEFRGHHATLKELGYCRIIGD